MALLWARHVIPEDARNFAAVATYTVALIPLDLNYFTAHAWSLSVEEIFYLAWPLLFILLHERKNLVKTTLLLIFAMPLVRLALYFAVPRMRGHEFYMVQGWADTMMGGCWLALFKASDRYGEFKKYFVRGWIALLLCVIGLYAAPVLVQHLPLSTGRAFRILISPSLVMIAAVVSICYLVENSETIVGRLFNLRAVRWVGVLSYSLYLWQQIFMSKEMHLLPWGYVYASVAAVLSYWLVEKPSYTLRSWLESNLRSRQRSRVA